MEIPRKTGDLHQNLLKISNCILSAETKLLHPVVESSLNACRRNIFCQKGKPLIQVGLFCEDFTRAPVMLLRSALVKFKEAWQDFLVPVVPLGSFLKSSF